MRRTLVALAALAAPLVVVLTLLPACSDDDAGDDGDAAPGGANGSPAEIVMAAPAATIAAGTARIAARAEVVDGDGEPVPTTFTPDAAPPGALDVDGLVDLEAHRGAMQVTAGALGGEGPGEIETGFDGDVAYLNFPVLGAALGAETDWISFDLEVLAEAGAGTDVAALEELSDTDPMRALGLLGDVTGSSVEEVGGEEVDGVATSRYTATVDLSTLADGAAERRWRERLREHVGADELAIEAWIDGDGRARRIRWSQPLTGAAAGGGAAALQRTLELNDLGTADPVELPPDDEVTDLTDVLLEAVAGG